MTRFLLFYLFALASCQKKSDMNLQLIKSKGNIDKTYKYGIYLTMLIYKSNKTLHKKPSVKNSYSDRNIKNIEY